MCLGECGHKGARGTALLRALWVDKGLLSMPVDAGHWRRMQGPGQRGSEEGAGMRGKTGSLGSSSSQSIWVRWRSHPWGCRGEE